MDPNEAKAMAENLWCVLLSLVLDLEEANQHMDKDTGEVYETHKEAREAIREYEEWAGIKS